MSVPYHTRSDSKPFSYSNVRSRSSSFNQKGCENPRDGALLSTGLTSPRLIRKMLGESTNETTNNNSHQGSSYIEPSSPPKTDSEESFREVPIRKSNLDFYELTREKESLISPKKLGLIEKNFDIKSSNSYDNFISSKKSPEEYYTKKNSPGEDIYNTINKIRPLTTTTTDDFYGKKNTNTTSSDTWTSKNSFSEDLYSSKKTNFDDFASLRKTPSCPNNDDIDFKRNPFEDFDVKKPSLLNGDSFSKKTLNETYHVPIKVEQSENEIIRDTSTSMADALMNKKNDESWLEKQLQKLKERKGVSTNSSSSSILTSTNVSSLNNTNSSYTSPSMTYTPITQFSKTKNSNVELDSPRAKLYTDSAFDDKGIRVPIQRDDKSSLLSDISSYTLGQKSDVYNDRSRSTSGIRRQRVDSESSELGGLDTSTLHQKLMAASLENGSSSRPITPAFPPGTPYNNRSRANTRAPSPCGLYSSSTQRRGSIGSIHSSEISGEESAINVKLVKDNFKYWYKPSITREEAIALLKQRPTGTFIVRDSHSFPGAYGMALKVSKPPPVSSKPRNPTADPLDELVRHFLIEPTTKGVKLKGYSNEPIFASLSSLVYQHSLTALALPTKLVLPQYDLTFDNIDNGGNNSFYETKQDSMRKLFDSGAACNVSYLFTMETDALTGGVAVDKTVSTFLELTKDIDNNPGLVVVDVHFKVTTQGITVTDNERKLFFRKHYNISTIGYCGLDPHNRVYVKSSPATKIFAFVAKKHGSRTHNQCHLFAALDPEQPAVAIVNFVNRVMAMTNPKRIEMV
ncbi:uncharacterized protein by [Lepeophtheirus salmonis]|uniref:uncharacterized protein by n=1 Tax=Lepeophtheirus salmonis TaxID=72036 RepID=UPI001AE2C20A|nr:tensin-4-like [Lepeophtheirus salmonis]